MKKEEIKNQIQVGDRVTHIKVSVEVGSYRGYGLGFKTKEVRNKVVEIVTKDNEDYKDVLKIERIGSNGWYTVYKKETEILDEVEKEYLTSVIKPFKDKVKSISKKEDYTGAEYIRITLFEKQNKEDINLPDFKPGTMYKNMELEKRYTLKELGLE